MFVLEYSELEVIYIWNKNLVVLLDKSFGVDRPMGNRIGRVVKYSFDVGVERKCGSDVFSELFFIHDEHGLEDQTCEC